MTDHLILLDRVHMGDELVDMEASRFPQRPSLDVTWMVGWCIRIVGSKLCSWRGCQLSVEDVSMSASFGDQPDAILDKGGKETPKVSHIGFAVPRRLT